MWKRPVPITWERQDSRGREDGCPPKITRPNPQTERWEQRLGGRSPAMVEQLNRLRGSGQERDPCMQRERHEATGNGPRSPSDVGGQRAFIPVQPAEHGRICISGRNISGRRFVEQRNADLPDPRISPVNLEDGQGITRQECPGEKKQPKGSIPGWHGAKTS